MLPTYESVFEIKPMTNPKASSNSFDARSKTFISKMLEMSNQTAFQPYQQPTTHDLKIKGSKFRREKRAVRNSQSQLDSIHSKKSQHTQSSIQHQKLLTEPDPSFKEFFDFNN